MARLSMVLCAAALAVGCGGGHQGRRPPAAVVQVQAEASLELGGDRAVPAVTRPGGWWLATTRAFEQNGGWNIDVVLDLGGRAPPERAVDYRFELVQRVVYETVSEPSHGPPVVRAVPVEGEHATAIEQSVCFQSTARGHGRYRVALRLERAQGLLPGEYLVSMTDDRGRRLEPPRALVLH